MKLCRRNGAKAYNGLKMLLYQGIIAYELWNDRYASEDPKKRALVWCDDHGDEKILSSMTLEEKVAQMFMVYMPSKKATAIQKKYQFGGYLLFANNFKNNSYKKKQSQFSNLFLCMNTLSLS